MYVSWKKGGGGGGGLVGLQDYSVLQASKLKHLDKRVSNFLKFSSHPAQSKLLFQGLNKISQSNGQEQLELHNVL